MSREALLSSSRRPKWCSTDPVCLEIGGEGQGLDSGSMAASHKSTLVRVTTGVEFNQLLDSGVVVRTHRHPEPGFFSRKPR